MPATGVLQVHPSVRCNLRCRHCYSSSGPDARGVLDDDVLAQLVRDAAALGYRTMAVSGGEPLMFRGLDRLLQAGREAGMRTLLTTNGTLLTERRLGELRPWLDLLAFSLDGPPALHNEVRAVPWAFDRLERGLRVAADAGVAHGLLYTVTASSLPWVSWGAELAVEHGCSLFQLHAIEDVGRARTEMRAQLLDGDLYEQAHHAAGVLAASHGHALHVHADLATRAQIERLEPAQLLGPAGEPSILVVEEDGTVSPMCHGFDRGWRVAELGRQRLRDGMACFVGDGDDRSGAGRLRELIGSTRDSLLASSRSVYDFVAELRRASNRTATEVDSVPVAVRVGG